MRLSATTTASILFSLLALEAVAAPAPQYDTTVIVFTTVEATAAGSAVASSPTIQSAPSSTTAVASASPNACKAKSAKPSWGQLWRQHRRPRPSASGDTTPTGPGQVSSPASQVPSVASSNAPLPSVEAPPSPSPTNIPIPSAVETVEPVTATAVQAGSDGGVEQPPLAQPSVVGSTSSYEFSSTFEVSSSFESSAAQPSASASAPAQGGSNGAPSGFASDILSAHNVFRATWGTSPLREGDLH